jgi:hypothetical protein
MGGLTEFSEVQRSHASADQSDRFPALASGLLNLGFQQALSALTFLMEKCDLRGKYSRVQGVDECKSEQLGSPRSKW